MSMVQADPITRLVQQCNPNDWLLPTDPRWVDFDEARGGSVIDRIERALRRANRPESKLFAGHRGIGKTSELKRLQQRLERKDASILPFFVVFLDATQQLDSNDLDFPDLLVLVAGEVQKCLASRNVPGFGTASTYLKRLWDDFRELLGSEVRLTGAEAEIPFATLALELRNRPSGRALLRQKIEALATDLIGAVNRLFDEADAALREAGHAGMILIVDGLDKISRRPLPDGGNTHDRLFIDRSEHLAGLRVHTIYTVPISMYYSQRCAILEQTFGQFNTPVSMIRIRNGPTGAVTPDSTGMQKLREMLELRCRAAQVEFSEAFDADSTWQHLCETSGGHPRHLLILLSSAANLLDELPITRTAVDTAIRDYANSLLREIPDRFWKDLRRFDRPLLEITKDEDHQEMLFLLHVFEYLNGRPWYEVNPVLRTLERFQTG